MTGYPESLTDPSYAGQLMVLTYPLVGNYGVPPFSIEENGLPTFMESEKIHAEAIIVSDYSEEYSHWNAMESLSDWLKREMIPGITGIDTRALTKKIREHGVMMGRILIDDETGMKHGGIAGLNLQPGSLHMPFEMPDYESINYVDRVSCKEIITYGEGEGKKHVVLLDCGVKANIIQLAPETWCEQSSASPGTMTSISWITTAFSSRMVPEIPIPATRLSGTSARHLPEISRSAVSAWGTSCLPKPAALRSIN